LKSKSPNIVKLIQSTWHLNKNTIPSATNWV